MKRIIGLLVLLTMLLIPGPALAKGVGMGPQTLEINNALRGSEYEQVFTVVNPSKEEDTYRMGAEGQVGGWLSFYNFENKSPLDKFIVAGESRLYVLANIKVPEDIANGTYNATVYAETAPLSDASNMGVSAVIRSDALLTVKVTGEQVIEGKVGTISAWDAEAGLPLRLEVNFENKGNIAVQPKITGVISKEGTKIGEFSYDKATVKAFSQENISTLWGTKADQTGNYSARVTVSLLDKILATQELPFKILPPGTFTKQGELTSLNYVGQPLLDTMLKIEAGFKNTGEGDARAKLIIEVYQEGNLVDTVKSEDTLVPVGKTDVTTSYLKLTKAGKYTIKGFISYEGKQTAVKELSFNVTPAANSQPSDSSKIVEQPDSQPSGSSKTIEQPGSFNIIYPIAAGIIAVIILSIFLTILRRNRD